MNKRRLLKLADLLEADAKNRKGLKFDLGKWGRSDDGEEAAAASCGTSACAMGLAVISGAFKRAGLTNFYGNGSPRICPKFGEYDGFDAATKLFDLRGNETYFLFDQDRYPSDKTTGAEGERYVAKRIRDFVAGKVTA